MTTADGGNARDGKAEGERNDRRGDRIGLGGGDDSVSRIQLAARWAEAFSTDSDSLGGMLKRFRAAYDYLDAVIHGVEPPELEDQVAESRAPESAQPVPVYAPPPPTPYPPQGSPYPPQGSPYPPQGYPPQGSPYPPQGYPPQGGGQRPPEPGAPPPPPPESRPWG